MATATQTSGLEPGQYPVELEVTAGGDTKKYAVGLLRLVQGPGSASPIASLCSYDDVLRFAPWLGDLQDERSDQAGFAEQRGRARTWLFDVIIARDRPEIYGRRGKVLGDPGFSTWPIGIWKWLRDQLEAGKLMTSGTRGDRIAEMCAKKAIAFVCDSQLGGRGETSYQALAHRFHREADDLVAGYIAELDINGDGLPDYWVRCGIASSR